LVFKLKKITQQPRFLKPNSTAVIAASRHSKKPA